MSADPQRLANEPISSDYIALTQNSAYASDPRWTADEKTKKDYIKESKLRFLRDYQIKAIKALQHSASEGKQRFLFEMATGTGKTLVSGAIIKLFLRTSNASRVLFLVDRIELENQAKKNFDLYLKNDYTTVIFKENRDDWRKAEIVVTTVQSLSFNSKYRLLFSPTDFDLIISDEAHRSISGNNRAVFEYFLGYKLGLTATPKDYLKNVSKKAITNDPKEWERRQLLDTYKTFGCESGRPTFQYSLLDGVRDGFLVNPLLFDARTEITTQLLSDEGYTINETDDDGEEIEMTFRGKNFEKTFFSDETNQVLCKTFLENAKRDPITGEIGKSIVFCVSRNHTTRIAQALNIMADSMFPGRYRSDFAMQITSDIASAQQNSINFANNGLSGHSSFLDDYTTSKTRACVTVGMMTTGYDCEDILNIVLLRPIFSPTDFIQIKGRGTRKWDFVHKETDLIVEKDGFALFDFFANYEYFEEKYDYKKVIKLPKPALPSSDDGGATIVRTTFSNTDFDPLKTMEQTQIGLQGMKIDRMMFQRFEEEVQKDIYAREQFEKGNITVLEEYIKQHYFDKPEEYITIDKLRKSLNIDRRVSFREILDKIFGRIEHIKNKNEMQDDEFEKFMLTEGQRNGINNDNYLIIKTLFKAYLSDQRLRIILDEKRYAELATHPTIRLEDIRKLGGVWLNVITEYIKDNVNLNQFAA